jgi:hypothetical protein
MVPLVRVALTTYSLGENCSIYLNYKDKRLLANFDELPSLKIVKRGELFAFLKRRVKNRTARERQDNKK